jgi:hypothetical protein
MVGRRAVVAVRSYRPGAAPSDDELSMLDLLRLLRAKGAPGRATAQEYVRDLLSRKQLQARTWTITLQDYLHQSALEWCCTVTLQAHELAMLGSCAPRVRRAGRRRWSTCATCGHGGSSGVQAAHP